MCKKHVMCVVSTYVCIFMRLIQHAKSCNDTERRTPRPPNDVLCIDSRRQLINALIANWPALGAILLYFFITGARRCGRK